MEEGAISVNYEIFLSAAFDMVGSFSTGALGHVGTYFLALVAVRLASRYERSDVGNVLEVSQVRAKLLLSVILVEELVPETGWSDRLW